MSSTRNRGVYGSREHYYEDNEDWDDDPADLTFFPDMPETTAETHNGPSQFVDLTADTPTQTTSQRPTRPRRQAADHGTAIRGPRFANDIIDANTQRGGAQAFGSRNESSSRMDDDGFEIVGQRQVSPSPFVAQTSRHLTSGYPGLNQLSMAQRNAVGTFFSTIARSMPLALTGFLPPSLDYRYVPYNNVGMPEIPLPDPEPPPGPRYQSPPAAPPGFTYTPSEDDVYVCPNCDEELRTGDSDLQRQVWVIKACGHAYCGQCAQNRSSTKHKKLKLPSKTKPFKQCCVDNCSARTTGVKSMTQIFI